MGLTLPDTWESSGSGPQLSSTRWQSQNLQAGVGQAQNSSNQVWTNGNTQPVPRAPMTTGATGYETAAIGFAEQAQGRSLPADINRFATLSRQGGFIQPNGHAVNVASRYPQNDMSAIELELIRVNQSLRNLEVKIENLATRLSYELRAVNTNAAGQGNVGSNLYQGVGEGARDAWLSSGPANGQLSEEERLRKLVIDSLLQQTSQEQAASPPAAGEISVKKNIIERLLEELNGPPAGEEKFDSPAAEDPGEFISLSDYISKIMREEKQN